MKFRKFINFIAYIGVVVLALGLILSSIPNKFGNWCNIIVTIAMWIEVAVGLVYGYLFARSQQQSWFMFGYGLAIIALIVIVIIRLAIYG